MMTMICRSKRRKPQSASTSATKAISMRLLLLICERVRTEADLRRPRGSWEGVMKSSDTQDPDVDTCRSMVISRSDTRQRSQKLIPGKPVSFRVSGHFRSHTQPVRFQVSVSGGAWLVRFDTSVPGSHPKMVRRSCLENPTSCHLIPPILPPPPSYVDSHHRQTRSISMRVRYFKP